MLSGLIQFALLLGSLVFVLGLVVIIHELGHYWAGRLFGAAAESFSVGFGKPIFERSDKRNTRWRVNWIPLGGFVKFVGESQTAGDVGKVEEGPIGKKYMDLTVGQRSVVAAAGPVANLVLAVLLFAIIALNFGRDIQKITVVGFGDGPAQAAGFEVDDIILSIDGKKVTANQDIQLAVSLSSGEELTFELERAGQIVKLDVVPERQETITELGQKVKLGRIGLEMRAAPVEHMEFNAFTAVGEGVRLTGEVVTTTGKMLGRLVTGREPITQLSGPVGIGDVSRRAVNQVMQQEAAPLSARFQALGWFAIRFIAVISIGVGLVNLLPLPVLDGGHLVFNAYEAVTGSVVPQRAQEVILSYGVIFLVGIAVIVTAGDIVKTGILQSFGG